MKMLLKAPEDIIIHQYDIPDKKKGTDKMYFIAKGKC